MGIVIVPNWPVCCQDLIEITCGTYLYLAQHLAHEENLDKVYYILKIIIITMTIVIINTNNTKEPGEAG